jgi:dihydropteroate synthase
MDKGGNVTQLQCAGRVLDLSKTQVMGILNVTPDSFSDGGHLYQHSSLSVDKALQHAQQMVNEGASIIDIGGESTRPGAAEVSVQEEMDRVLPVLERINAEIDVVVSIDTSSPELISESAKLGAGLINDVRALGREGALEAAAKTNLPVCLMHMQGSPATMQRQPEYDDVVSEVMDFLDQQLNRCMAAGIAKERLMVDPGFGFGKTLQHNLQLLNRLDKLLDLGVPVLSGTSRKTMVGQVLNRESDQRLFGSLATVALAVERGARVIRVHDVLATVDMVRMTEAVLKEGI